MLCFLQETLTALRQAVRTLDIKVSSLAVQTGADRTEYADLQEASDIDYSVNSSEEYEASSERFWKRIALATSILLIVSPFLLYHYVDHIAEFLGADQYADGNKASFSRRLEYR